MKSTIVHRAQIAEVAGSDAHPRGNPTGRPPRPELAVQIGVVAPEAVPLPPDSTGELHRTVRDVLARLRAAVDEVVLLAAGAYAPGPPHVRIVSCLATGAERLVVEEALALGFELQCVTSRAGDDPEASARLRRHATAVLELEDLSPVTEHLEPVATAYEVVLDQSDVLVVLAGACAERDGGATGQLMRVAVDLEIPTTRVDIADPFVVHAVTRDAVGRLHMGDGSRVFGELRALLVPPSSNDAGDGRQQLRMLRLPPAGTLFAWHGNPRKRPDTAPDLRAAYFAEAQPRWSIVGLAWQLFAALFGGWFGSAPRIRIADRAGEVGAEWLATWPRDARLPPAVTARLDRCVLPHYAWADVLARYYADTYRGSFVLTYAFGTGAVLSVLLAYALGVATQVGRLDALKAVAAPAFIAFALVLSSLEQRRHWHDRWIDYRLLAELLRQLRFLAPLGGVPRLVRAPAHAAYGDPRHTWVAWYVRAIARSTGLVGARCDRLYLAAYRTFLWEGLLHGPSGSAGNNGMARAGGQLAYHRQNAQRFATMRRRGVTVKSVLLWSTAALMAVLLGARIWHYPVSLWLTLLVGAFPAVSTAMAGILSQAEVGRGAKRSHGMAERLTLLTADLPHQSDDLSGSALRRIAQVATDTLIAELLDWRIVFETKPFR